MIDTSKREVNWQEGKIFTAQQKRESAEREVKMRRRVYKRWIEAGRMTQTMADQEIAIMDAIADDYRKLEQGERLI